MVAQASPTIPVNYDSPKATLLKIPNYEYLTSGGLSIAQKLMKNSTKVSNSMKM